MTKTPPRVKKTVVVSLLPSFLMSQMETRFDGIWNAIVQLLVRALKVEKVALKT